MAMYHCHFKIFKRGEGRSAVGGAAYRSGEKITNEYDGATHDYSGRKSVVASASYRSGGRLANENNGEVHDFSGRNDIVFSEIMLPANAPREFLDRATLWNAIEKKDRRKDSQLAREADISLPIELNTEQQIDLVREYVNENFVAKGVCADVNIHNSGDGNPHFHLQLTMRDVDESGFGGRREEEQGRGYFQSKQRLKSWRKSWTDIANKHLEKHGFSARIDHRTLKEQGITDREPMKYMGLDYKHKKKILVIEQEQDEIIKYEIPITNAEIRRIEREIERLEAMKKELTEIQGKLEKLEQTRTQAKAKDQADIDRQIFYLKKSYETAVSRVEREIEMMERESVRTNRERPTRERPPIMRKEGEKKQTGIEAMRERIAERKRAEQDRENTGRTPRIHEKNREIENEYER